MRFKYSTTAPSQDEFDSLPRLPLLLTRNNQSVQVTGLVDCGATVNVLPYEVDQQLGAIWDSRKATIRLAGNLRRQVAMPLVVMAKIADFNPVRLVFPWVKTANAPLILGQTNFFIEFDVCLYRSKLEFEIHPSS